MHILDLTPRALTGAHFVLYSLLLAGHLYIHISSQHARNMYKNGDFRYALSPVRTPGGGGVKSRIRPPYPQRVVKGD